ADPPASAEPRIPSRPMLLTSGHCARAAPECFRRIKPEHTGAGNHRLERMNARRCPERANLKPFRGSVAQVASRDFNAITCHNARHISPGHLAARKTSWRQSMSVTKTQVLEELRRVKGPDLEGNIVDLGLVSEILIKDERVYFSITVPPERAHELEP